VDHSKTTSFDDGSDISCLGLQANGIFGYYDSADCEFRQLLASRDCGCYPGPTECTDDASWVDTDDDDCSDYEQYVGCQGAAEYANAVGVSAFDACCICGGGSPIAAPSPTAKPGRGGVYAGVAALVLILILGAIVYYRRKKSTSSPEKSDAGKPVTGVDDAPSRPTHTPTEPSVASVVATLHSDGSSGRPTATAHQKNPQSHPAGVASVPESHHSNDSSHLPVNKDQCRSFAGGQIAAPDIVVFAYPVDEHESPSHSGVSSLSSRRAYLDP